MFCFSLIKIDFFVIKLSNLYKQELTERHFCIFITECRKIIKNKPVQTCISFFGKLTLTFSVQLCII